MLTSMIACEKEIVFDQPNEDIYTLYTVYTVQGVAKLIKTSKNVTVGVITYVSCSPDYEPSKK